MSEANCSFGCSFLSKTRILLTRELILEMNNKDIAKILKQFKLDNDLLKIVERAFQQVVEDKTYEMKASHIVPSYASKSIKISTKIANIAISP